MRIKRMSERLKLYEDFLTEAEEKINQNNFTPEQKDVIQAFFNDNNGKIDFSKNKFLNIKSEIENIKRTRRGLVGRGKVKKEIATYLNFFSNNTVAFEKIIDALKKAIKSLNVDSIDQDERKKELVQDLEKPLKIMIANTDEVKKELSDISTNKHSLIDSLTDKESLKNTLNELQEGAFDFSNDLASDILKAPNDLSDFIDYLNNYDTTSDEFALYRESLKKFRDVLEKSKNLVTDISEEELANMKSNALRACDEVIAVVNTYLDGTTKVNPMDSKSENKLKANIKDFDNLLMQGEDEKAEKLAVNFLNDIETNNFGVYTESFSLYEGIGETVKDILGNDFLGWIKAVKLGQLARTDNPFMNLILKNDDLWKNGFCRNLKSDKAWFLKIYNWIITYKISGSGLEDFIANSKIIRAEEPLKQKQLLNLQDVQLNYMITQEYDYWDNNGKSLDKLDYNKLYQNVLNLKKSRWGDFEQSDELERTIGDGGPVTNDTNTKKQVESGLKALVKNDPATAAEVAAKYLKEISEKDLRKAFGSFTQEEKNKIRGGLK